MISNIKEMEEKINYMKQYTEPDCPEIKIKLLNGTVIDIAELEFYNIGDDGVIYIKEADKEWEENKEELRLFIRYGYQIAQSCNVIIKNRHYEDPDFALESIINVAREADYWLNKLNIKHDYDPLTGPDNEIFGKIDLLRKWYNKHIKRDIDKL